MRFRRASNPPPIGQVNLGDLRRVEPISSDFGYDRGKPVDRYYIEDFLGRHAADIRGRVLEIGDDEYTRRFGGDRVTQSDVLHVEEGNPKATIVGDLTQADHIPSDTFDAVILTQTLHLIYDAPAAVRTLHRILRPGGVLLATFPGISQIGEGTWASVWYWAFTERSGQRLFEEVFGAANIVMEVRGNVLAATAFLNGLAAEELKSEELDHVDRSYPVTLAVAAAKKAPAAVMRSSGDQSVIARGEGTQQQPVVSVIMPFYNAAAFIAEAVESVRAQSYDNWELLLVDDGSEDQSTALARALAVEMPERVRYLEHDKHQNRGISATRNAGIRAARGEYICFLDADDIWLPHKLERQVELLQALSEADITFGQPLYWYGWAGTAEAAARDHVPELGFVVGRVMRPPELSLLSYPLGEGDAPSMSDFMARRELFERVGGFEESFTGMYEDQAFMAKVYLAANVYISSECWSKYRIHDTSCSADSARKGSYHDIRRRFLEWFETYLSDRSPPPAIRRALRRALRAYRHPRLNAVTVRIAPITRAAKRALQPLLPSEPGLADPVSRWRRLATLRARLIEEQLTWIREIQDGNKWLEEQVHNWERIAQEREKLIEDQRAWNSQLEQGKNWLEEQWRHWQSIAEERGRKIDRLKERLAKAEARAASRGRED